MGIMHGFAVERRTVFYRMLTTRRVRPMVALAIVEMVIDVSVEVIRPMKPRSCADEDPAREPLRAIVAVRSAVVRRNLVIPVRAHRGGANFDCNLCGRAMAGSSEQHGGSREKTQELQFVVHFSTSACL